MRYSILTKMALASALVFSFVTSAETLFLAGDSTVQDVDPDKSAEQGWGQRLPDLVKASSSLTIDNHARGGRSTRTFIEEGRWQALLAKVEDGDWVMIQFGHNDQSYSHPDRYTSPKQYRDNLRKFIDDVRGKKANPILITPVSRRYFDNNGELRDAHGMYPEIVIVVAQKTQTPLIDLTATSWQAYVEAGPDKSKTWFNHMPSGKDKRHPDGVTDDTHFSQAGATFVAKLVVAEMQMQQEIELADEFESVKMDNIDFSTSLGF